MKTIALSFLALAMFVSASSIGAADDQVVVVMKSDSSLHSEQIPDQTLRADDQDSLAKLKKIVGGRTVLLKVESDAPAVSVKKVTELLSSPEHSLKISQVSPKANTKDYYSSLFDQRQAAQLQKIEMQMRKLESLKQKIELRAARKAEIIAKQMQRGSSHPIQYPSTSKSKPNGPNPSATTTSLLRQNEVAIAKLNLERAIRRLSTIEQLKKKNHASETEFQDATFDARQAELELNRAKILAEESVKLNENRAQIDSALSRQSEVGSSQTNAKENVALRRHDVQVAELDLERALDRLSLYRKAGRNVPAIKLSDAEYEVRKAELALSRAKALLEEAERNNAQADGQISMEKARREKVQLILENQLKQAEVLMRKQEKLVSNVQVRFAAGTCTEDELIEAKSKHEIAALEYERLRVLLEAQRTGIELATTLSPSDFGSDRRAATAQYNEVRRKLAETMSFESSFIEELADQEDELVRRLKYQDMDQKERNRLEDDLEYIRKAIVRSAEVKLHASLKQGAAKRAELQRKAEEGITALDEDLLRSKNLGIEIRRRLEKFQESLESKSKTQDGLAENADKKSPDAILRELGGTIIGLKMEIRKLAEHEKIESARLENIVDEKQRAQSEEQLARIREHILRLTKQQILAAKKAEAAKRARLNMRVELLRIDKANASTRLAQSIEAFDKIKQIDNPSDIDLQRLEEARERTVELQEEVEALDAELKLLESESNSSTDPASVQ